MKCLIFPGDLAWGGLYYHLQGIYYLSKKYEKVILIIKPQIETGNGNDGINYILKEYKQLLKNINNIEYIEYNLNWNKGQVHDNIAIYLNSLKNDYDIFWCVKDNKHNYNLDIKYIDYLDFHYKAMKISYNIRYDIGYSFFDDKKCLDIFNLFQKETNINKFILCSLTCSHNKNFQKDEFEKINSENKDMFILNLYKNLYKEDSKFYEKSIQVQDFFNKYLRYDFGFFKCILLLKYFILKADKLYLSDSNIWSVASILDLKSEIYLYTRNIDNINWNNYTKNKIKIQLFQ